MKPSSSPSTAKMKSLCCTRRKLSWVWLPLPRPRPHQPPEPTLMRAWIGL